MRVRRPDGTELEILSSCVVVAAGALQSPQLLRRSGLGRHPRLGRNLSVHMIADRPLLPGCPEVNPQLPIMAGALAVTEAHVR
ncbi:GMC family oxidoreductase N-terminal domain-containing protein [Streptomyces sp. NPDC058268]|uniref:GMC family oxidoreductase N-terminal domain-containing protein n=1 Tax=Streptomyces sp. NPDC058268 TaxID=3346413 RepID=UPI0036DFED9E